MNALIKNRPYIILCVFCFISVIFTVPDYTTCIYTLGMLLSVTAFLYAMEMLKEKTYKNKFIQKYILPVRKELWLSISLGSFVFCMFESLYGASFKTINALILFVIPFNIILISMPYFICSGLFSDRGIKISFSVITVFYFVWAMVNHYFYEFRNQPITFSDFYLAGTAVNVLGGYQFNITLTIVFILLCIIFILSKLWKSSPLIQHSVKKCIVMVVLGIYILIMVLYASQSLIFKLWNISVSTERFGYVLSFFRYIEESFKDVKPDGYNADETEDILAQYEDSWTFEQDEQADNIIVIMNESFADLCEIYDFTTNEDPLEFYHSLSGDNIYKGFVLTSCYGGSTGNSEYEFLTGNPISFTSAYTVPYVQYIHNEQQTIAWLLKNSEFTTIAYHPYLGNGYDRNYVYDLLGFDEFICYDDLSAIHSDMFVREYVSDSSDYHELIEMYENKEEENFFIFNVTIQNHGGYDSGLSDENIIPDDENFQNDCLIEYLSILDESDAALEELISYFSEVDENTIILFFGDHQPAFDENVIEILCSDLSDDIYSQMKQYMTPYLIWANYDISDDFEIADVTSLNFLRSKLLQAAGIEGSAYDSFILSVYEEYPAINTIGFIDSEGNVYDAEMLNSVPVLTEYKNMVYYNLFDHDNMNKALFR